MLAGLLKARKTDLIGLDVGSRAVKLVRLRRSGGGYIVTAAGIADIGQADDGSSVADSKRVEEAIGRCLATAQVHERYAVAGLTGSEVMVRGFSFPPLPPEAVEQAVFLEAQSVCALDMKSSALDYQLVGADQDAGSDLTQPRPRCGLMAAASEHLIKQRTSQLTSAGLKPVYLDVEALALLNCVNELNLVDSQATCAIIDMGYSTTSVIIYGKNGLPFVRDLNSAGGGLLKQIAREHDTDERTVHEVLCDTQAGTCSREKRNSMLLSLNTAIRPLVMMINETIRFHSMHEKDPVGQVFLCGGFSLVSTFTEMLSDALPVETAVLNPLDHVQWDVPGGQQALKACGPALAVATGLAMRTL